VKLNLSLLHRLYAQPWAIRREHLSLLPQMIAQPKPSGRRARNRRANLKSGFEDGRPQITLGGYQPLSDEA